jgi:hypothetical protein
MALNWTVESLRVSLFFADLAKLNRADWKRITDKDEPETEQKAGGRHAMSAHLFGGHLTLAATGPRIDCIVSPLVPPDPGPGYVPSIGPWPQSSEQFIGATEEWLSGFSTVLRVAFAANLPAAQPDVRQSYVALLSMLKSVRGDASRMRDLLFASTGRCAPRP